MSDFYFDDMQVGQRFATADIEVSEADIIDFARRFDPQYFHLDPAAAAGSAFGGLIASGFHTLSLSFRLFFDLNLWQGAILGSPGLREVTWLKPLRPGDRIRGAIEVIDTKRSASKPDRGIVTTRHETFNQRDEIILTAICPHLLRAR